MIQKREKFMSINSNTYHSREMNRFFQENAIQMSNKIRKEEQDYQRRREHNQEREKF